MITGPTFEEMLHPHKIPATIRQKALAARSSEASYFQAKALECIDRALELSPASSEYYLGRAFAVAELAE